MLTKNKLNLLRLIRSENIGNSTLTKLLEKYKSAENILNNIENINNKLKRKIILASEKSIQQELKLLDKINGRLIFKDDEQYPDNLRFIEDAPYVLSCIGNIGLLKQEQIAIVGSRQVSAIGKRYTKKVASSLAKKGFVITSGLARGVDALAHQGALQAKGKTIAVLGSSVDFVYPSENKELYQDIIDNDGLIISENATGSGIVSKHQFPKRNRIIAALSKAVIVTECTKKSGSLITAKLALEMGKDLFAVPGHPADLHFEGTNNLIKQNCAYLLTSMDDILQQIDLPQEQKELKVMAKKTLLEIQEDILIDDELVINEPISLQELIKNNPLSFDEIVRQLDISESQAATEITMLELEGKIKRLEGGLVELV